MMIVLGPGSGSGSAIWAPAASFTLLLLLLFTCLTPPVTGLSTAPGSPCEDVCHKTSTNTTSVEIVCEDKQFSNTRKGSHFAQCVECELDSDYVDPGTGETDVAWGLCTSILPPIWCLSVCLSVLDLTVNQSISATPSPHVSSDTPNRS